jgi:hypothetical protein
LKIQPPHKQQKSHIIVFWGYFLPFLLTLLIALGFSNLKNNIVNLAARLELDNRGQRLPSSDSISSFGSFLNATKYFELILDYDYLYEHLARFNHQIQFVTVDITTTIQLQNLVKERHIER